MNLDQLEVLQSIINEGGFRAASQALNKSQPALSVAIKNLEEEFGIELFDRSSYRPKLTQAGQTIYQAAQRVLESTQSLKRIAHELGNDKVETLLRVSADPLVDLKYIELISQECARPSFPVVLVLNKTILTGGVADLLDGSADLAVGPCDEHNQGVDVIEIQQVKLVTVASRKLLAELNRPTKKFLETHAQILIYNKQFDEFSNPVLSNARHQQGQKIYAHDHFMKKNLIEDGLGWGRLAEHEIAGNKDLVRVPASLAPEAALRICLMRSSSKPLGPIARRIWKTFTELRP